jgi:hypothetical protein
MTLVDCNHVNNDIPSNDSLFTFATSSSLVAFATLEFHNCWCIIFIMSRWLQSYYDGSNLIFSCAYLNNC